MKRLFGKAPPLTDEQKKEQQRQRKPTLEDANESVRPGNRRCFAALTRCPQLDKRGGTLDEKIKKLDEELRRHKEIIAKARPGPAQVGAQARLPPYRPLTRTARRKRRSKGRCACCDKRSCALCARHAASCIHSRDLAATKASATSSTRSSSTWSKPASRWHPSRTQK